MRLSRHLWVAALATGLRMGGLSADDDKDRTPPPNPGDEKNRKEAQNPGQVQDPGRALKDSDQRDLGLTSNLCRASDVIGKKVENEQGENLGKIEDVVLDAPQGKIVYAVLSFGGVLGIGDKLFAIPWGALREEPGKKACILSIDKEKLKKAPGFDQSHWPDMASQQWGLDIHRYYGVEPVSWRQGGASDPRFGESDLRREAVKLPLKLSEGQSYRYAIESHPAATIDPGLPGDARTAADVGKSFELQFDVVKSSGGESTIQVSCSSIGKTADERGRKDPAAKAESCTYTVAKDGKISEPAPAPGKEAMSRHVQTHLGHIFGYRLHDANLDPGKEVSMPGSVQDLLGHPDATGRGQHRMRYEGVTKVGGQRAALFSILPATNPEAGEPRKDVASIQAGRVAYRTDDGLLERLSIGGSSIRRLPTQGVEGN